jgi:hypothetical protein
VAFQLPEQLPATVAELDELRGRAQAQINVIQARHEAGEELTRDDAAELRRLLDAVDTIGTARDEAATAEAEHATEVNDLLTRAQGQQASDETPDDADADAQEGGEAPDVVAEGSGDQANTDQTDIDQGPAAVAASGNRPVTFGGAGANDAPENEGPGWQMHPTAPRYRPGRVGFAELGLALDSVRPGSRSARQPNRSNMKRDGREYSRQVVATLDRGVEAVDDSHALVAAIEKATREVNGQKVTAQALTAAGGWCAPSEQLYDFCDVPDATDLLSLPEITINRGGIRWPVEPDLSSIFESFQFFFTEVELEQEDGGGNPTAIKECVSIPCPDEFDEIRLNAVGYCVEAGILQTQGWPELITWFMQHLAQEHLRAISRRSILDVVNGSGSPIITPPASVMGSIASVLNSLELNATNIRLRRGLSRTATIEGIAPSWFAAVLRADLAMRGDDIDLLSVTDAQVNEWLTARNIALQYVGDWQTRDAGYPGALDTLAWPASVDVVLYPAGTWFRSMSPVIELGVFYPKEQLQVNRYTRFFTEDAIAVGRRCNVSVVGRIPLAVTGAIGPRIDLSSYYTTARASLVIGEQETGVPITTAGSQTNVPKTYTLATSGTPTAGTVDIGVGSLTAAGVAWNATNTAIHTAIAALDTGFGAADFTVTGGPLSTAPLQITVPQEAGAVTVTPHLTGGSATVS